MSVLDLSRALAQVADSAGADGMDGGQRDDEAPGRIGAASID
jgi:hypothetical protein